MRITCLQLPEPIWRPTPAWYRLGVALSYLGVGSEAESRQLKHNSVGGGNMYWLTPEGVIVLFGLIGVVAAIPAVIQALKRRRTGETYETSFWVQRAPQLAVLVNVLLLERAFSSGGAFNLFAYVPYAVQAFVSWLGVALYISGLTFRSGVGTHWGEIYLWTPS